MNAPVIDLLALATVTTFLKHVSNTNGGEWAGPCPFCGGTDRFRVQPNRPDGGKWFCRGCGEGYWHDALDYIQRRDNVSLSDAKQRLESESPSLPATRTEIPETDRQTWINRGVDFWVQCAENLFKPEAKPGLDWLRARGLGDEILEEYCIGWNPTLRYERGLDWGILDNKSVSLPRGIVIPCIENGLHNITVRRFEGDRPATDADEYGRYWKIKGGKNYLYAARSLRYVGTAFIFESQLDALLALQTGYKIGAVALSAMSKIHKGWGPLFSNIEKVIIAYDEDEVGQKAAAELTKLFPMFHKAPPLPAGKDLGEYFQICRSHSLITAWLAAGVELCQR